MIVTISGKSGSGKTTLLRELTKHKDIFHFDILDGYTTRPMRTSDLIGENIFISERQFQEKKDAGEIIGGYESGGNRYGVSKSAVDVAMGDTKTIYLRVLSLHSVHDLRTHISNKSAFYYVRHIYLYANGGDTMLYNRMRKRGDSEVFAKSRLSIEHAWDDNARQAHMVMFVANDDPKIDLAVAGVLEAIRPFIIQ